MRFQVSAEGLEYGPPKTLRACLRHVRLVSKRDGKFFRFTKPTGHDTRLYRGPMFFSLKAGAILKNTVAGDVSHFATRIGDGMPEARRYRVRTVREPAPTSGEQVVAFAIKQIGTPYIFGAQNGPDDVGTDSFDCSGLTAEAWSQEGVYLVHSAEGQRVSGNVTLFYDASHAAAGDLVFFNFPNTRGINWPHASHVGIWERPGYVIDTRSPSEPVARRPIETGHVVGYGRVKVD